MEPSLPGGLPFPDRDLLERAARHSASPPTP